MSNSKSSATDPSAKKQLKSPWLLYLVLASIGIIATGMIWKSAGEASELQTELATLRATDERLSLQLEDLSAQEAKLDAALDQSKLWRVQLRDIYNEYRDLEDFAPNPSKLIISSDTRMIGIKRFSIPKGKHTLMVDITKLDRKSKEVIDQIQKSYDLVGDAAYFLKLDHGKAHYKIPDQLRLSVTSDADGFTNISEKLFEPMVVKRSSRMSSRSQTVSFPNELHEPIDFDHLEKHLGKGVLLLELEWTIKPIDEEPFNLKFDIRIVSDGPDVVDSSLANSFDPQKDYQVEYLQDGVFEVLKIEGSE